MKCIVLTYTEQNGEHIPCNTFTIFIFFNEKQQFYYAVCICQYNMHRHVTIFIPKCLLILQEETLDIIQFIHLMLQKGKLKTKKSEFLSRVTKIHSSELYSQLSLWTSKLPPLYHRLCICFACVFPNLILKKKNYIKLKEW